MLAEFLRKKTGTIYVKTQQKNQFKKGKARAEKKQSERNEVQAECTGNASSTRFCQQSRRRG